MKKIIITGGRDFNDYDLVEKVLNEIKPDVVIHGKCSGADTIASNWAYRNHVPQIPYPYPSKYGKSGGPIRNRQMCEDHKDAMVIAFPGGAGTRSCVTIARELGLSVAEVNILGELFQTFGSWNRIV